MEMKSVKPSVLGNRSKKDKTSFSYCMKTILKEVHWDDDYQTRRTNAEILCRRLFDAALNERDLAKRTKAFELIRDTVGQKPVDRIEQQTTNLIIDLSDFNDD